MHGRVSTQYKNTDTTNYASYKVINQFKLSNHLQRNLYILVQKSNYLGFGFFFLNCCLAPQYIKSESVSGPQALAGFKNPKLF